MKIINVEQNTPEWFEARMGIPTASEFDALVTPLWKVRTGAGVDSYLARKLAERWRGEPMPSFEGGGQMEQGKIREGEARPWYEFDSGRTIRTVGFVTTDDGKAGCSPDGMFDDGTGIEIKCPEHPTHVRYLLDGSLPADYRAQVQGSMYVTGANTWTFLSYARGFPPLLLTIQSDPIAQEAIAEAVTAFNERLDKGWSRLCELNGGPPAPRRRVERTTTKPEGWDLSLAEVL